MYVFISSASGALTGQCWKGSPEVQAVEGPGGRTEAAIRESVRPVCIRVQCGQHIFPTEGPVALDRAPGAVAPLAVEFCDSFFSRMWNLLDIGYKIKPIQSSLCSHRLFHPKSPKIVSLHTTKWLASEKMQRLQQ